MAKPIGNTPVFEGEEAAEFINKIFEPPTKKKRNLKKVGNSKKSPILILYCKLINIDSFV